jgi:hypothetical protein
MKVPMTDSSHSMNPRGFRPFTGNGKPYNWMKTKWGI